jgi:hypothetical protein
MNQPAHAVIPLPDDARDSRDSRDSRDARVTAALGASALWMLGVSVMVGVVVVAGLASAALAVRVAT